MEMWPGPAFFQKLHPHAGPSVLPTDPGGHEAGAEERAGTHAPLCASPRGSI